MVYTTMGGTRLTINRLPRYTLDQFTKAHPAPTPPMKKVKVFGGIEEEIENTDDPEYLSRLLAYQLSLAKDQFNLIMQSVEVEWGMVSGQQVDELVEMGIRPTAENVLRFVLLSDQDLVNVVSEIFYQSTVTYRGIQEACKSFEAKWSGDNVLAWRVRASPGSYSLAFEEREAARFALVQWKDFLDLPGPDQSAIVAHYRISKRFEALMAQGNNG